MECLKIWPCTTSALSHCAVYTILYKCIFVFVSIRQDELVLTLGTVLGWCWHRVLRNSYTLHLSRTSFEYYHLHDNTPPNSLTYIFIEKDGSIHAKDLWILYQSALFSMTRAKYLCCILNYYTIYTVIFQSQVSHSI